MQTASAISVPQAFSWPQTRSLKGSGWLSWWAGLRLFEHEPLPPQAKHHPALSLATFILLRLVGPGSHTVIRCCQRGTDTALIHLAEILVPSWPPVSANQSPGFSVAPPPRVPDRGCRWLRGTVPLHHKDASRTSCSAWPLRKDVR